MAASLKLETFAHDSTSESFRLFSQDQLARENSLSFQAGFDAGMKHAEELENTKQANLKSAVSNALQELSFTHIEARKQIIGSLKPLVEALVKSFFPLRPQQSLSEQIEATLRAYSLEQLDTPISILVNLANFEAVQRLIGSLPPPSVAVLVRADDALGSAEATVSTQRETTHINVERMLAEMIETTEDFFTLSAMEEPHAQRNK